MEGTLLVSRIHKHWVKPQARFLKTIPGGVAPSWPSLAFPSSRRSAGPSITPRRTPPAQRSGSRCHRIDALQIFRRYRCKSDRERGRHLFPEANKKPGSRRAGLCISTNSTQQTQLISSLRTGIRKACTFPWQGRHTARRSSTPWSQNPRTPSWRIRSEPR